jgi:hypothetical protein
MWPTIECTHSQEAITPYVGASGVHVSEPTAGDRPQTFRPFPAGSGLTRR